MKMLEDSAIVVAHPDDENLWFSSVLSRVGQIVICFLPVASNPTWTKGRERSLASYPLPNLSALALAESEVFWGVNWNQPVETDYGLLINSGEFSDTTYVANFAHLKARLRSHLQNCSNVFTHNPWGEYGHPEHIQVYRAVKALQPELGYALWYSSYVSNKSAALMGNILARIPLTSTAFPTDKEIAQDIAEIYKSNGCWTWYDDYAWPDTESFVVDQEPTQGTQHYGDGMSLNFIKIEPPAKPSSPLRRRLTRLRARLRIQME